MLKSEYNYKGCKNRKTFSQELRGLCVLIVLMTTIVTQSMADSGGKNKARISTSNSNSLTRDDLFYLDKNDLSDTAGLAPGRTFLYQNNFSDFQKSIKNVKNYNSDIPFLPYSIFQPTDAPDELLNNDNVGGIEVGVKFRSAQAGTIDGIRYYKGAGTTGVHKGHLWSNGGSLLVEATFINETSSGWQEVLFSSPVAIEPNITYIASCHSASGDYAATNAYFVTATINASLKALADGEDGSNGVYLYTNSTAFPTNTSGSSNYWVDIIFSAGAAGGGTINGTVNNVAKFTGTNAVGNSIIYDNGASVGIGTTDINSTDYKLFVQTGIRTRKVRVDIDSWPDYVFDKKYQLPSLRELEKFINNNKHLPGIPSADEVEQKGIDLGNQQALLLKKIEELTLYIIQQNKKYEQLKKELDAIKSMIK